MTVHLRLRVDLGATFNEPPDAELAINTSTTSRELLGLILEAFGFDDGGHLWAIYLPPTMRTELIRPGSALPRLAQGTIEMMCRDAVALDEALADGEIADDHEVGPLRSGDSFWCRFDFGDEWWFRLRVDRVKPGGVISHVVTSTDRYEQYPEEA